MCIYIYIHMYEYIYIYIYTSILPCQAAKQLARVLRDGGHLAMPRRAFERLVEGRHRRRGGKSTTENAKR